MIKYSIYALLDPDNTVRYVGKTIQPLALRLNQHIQDSKRKNKKNKKCVWIKQLIENGEKPSIILLEETTKKDWRYCEQKWADFYSVNLTNDMNMIGTGGTSSHFAKWTNELDSLLGVLPDSEVAKKIGVTRKSVSYRRSVLGIKASFNRKNNAPPPPMGGHNKIQISDDIVSLFGKMPDYQLASKIGVCKTVIARRRKSLGIKSFAEQTGNNGQYGKGPNQRCKPKKIEKKQS